LNSNSKTKFEFKQRRRKEKQKKKKREEASLRPRPARLHGPASPTAPVSPTGQPRQRAATGWPTSSRRPSSYPARRSRPHASLPSLAAAATRAPHVSPLVHLLHAMPRLLTPIPFPDRAPTALAGASQGVTPGAWPCLLGAAPTQPLAVVGCKLAPSITLDPHPPITGLHRSPIGYKAPALVP